jgi:hypothetical protein
MTEKNERQLQKAESDPAFAAIEDRQERERRIGSLAPEERQLALEVARFADLCQYLSQKYMGVPPHILDELSGFQKLALPDRTERMKALNQSLMEYLNDAGEDTGIRQ